MRIYITNKDIKEGIQASAKNCPIARAVKRKLGDRFVCVGLENLVFKSKETNLTIIYPLSDHIKQFIRKFDSNIFSIKRTNFRFNGI